MASKMRMNDMKDIRIPPDVMAAAVAEMEHVVTLQIARERQDLDRRSLEEQTRQRQWYAEVLEQVLPVVLQRLAVKKVRWTIDLTRRIDYAELRKGFK